MLSGIFPDRPIARNVHRAWAANEKTAMESALGMSYAGKRALVCMKHVGMNVAADCFMNAAITGANGGLVVSAASKRIIKSCRPTPNSSLRRNWKTSRRIIFPTQPFLILTCGEQKIRTKPSASSLFHKASTSLRSTLRVDK